jgi:hypothetical protein
VAVDPLTVHLVGATASVGELLEREVDVLRDAQRDGLAVVAKVLRGTGCGTGTDEELLGQELSVPAARRVVAKDRGFADWETAMRHRNEPVDLRFEAAADAIQWGRLEDLRRLLDAQPALIEARSPFAHHAMLIHHVAANGIEVRRQLQSPPNAVEILRLLLERGADPDAVCDTYHPGSDTTLYLLVSSVWPAVAGVQGSLVEELCRGGAAVNGLDDDGLPLWTAITFGYTEAVDALARAGARVDNIVFAAALGDLPLVESYFDAEGTLRATTASSAARVGVHGPALEPDRLADYALIWAAGHGRRNIVEFLLGKDPDLSTVEPVFESTALGAARYFDELDIVELIERATPR